MKLFLLCDYKSGYSFDGIPYIGKEIGTFASTKGLVVKMVKELSADLLITGRNITTDNFFTDFQLAEELLFNRIVRKNKRILELQYKNKRDIPESFITKKRDPNISLFDFDKHSTLVFYAPKKNRSVILLSTMDHDKAAEEEIGKSERIIFCNTTKGVVHTVSQPYHSYNVERKTKR